MPAEKLALQSSQPTTVQDLANVVARAIGFEGEWPVIGGIQGTKISVGQLIALGEKVRGRFTSILYLHSKEDSCADICVLGI